MDLHQIKKYIAENETQTAFAILRNCSSENGNSILNDIVLLENNFNDCIKSYRLSLISFEDKALRINKINNALLQIIDELRPLEENNINNINLCPNENSNKDYILSTITLHLRETDNFVDFYVPDTTNFESLALVIVKKLFPDLLDEDYEWFIEYKGRRMKKYQTVLSANIKDKEIINLTGEHRNPNILMAKEKAEKFDENRFDELLGGLIE